MNPVAINCPNCKAPIHPNANEEIVVCLFCRSKIVCADVKQNQTNPNTELGEGILRISKEFCTTAQTNHIFINGAEVAQISNGEVVDLTLLFGTHKLEIIGRAFFNPSKQFGHLVKEIELNSQNNNLCLEISVRSRIFANWEIIIDKEYGF